MVLLQVIIHIPVRAMAHSFPQDSFEGTGIGVVAITGNSLRDTTGDGAGGAKEGFCRCLIPLLTEQDIHEVPISIDGPVEIDQAPFHFEERLVDIPPASNSPSSMLAQRLAQQGGKLGFPLPYSLMSENQASLQEHFGVTAQRGTMRLLEQRFRDRQRANHVKPIAAARD